MEYKAGYNSRGSGREAWYLSVSTRNKINKKEYKIDSESEDIPELKADDDEPLPSSVVPVEDVRLNLNVAPAEQIAKRLPGVGYATAKKIVELRMSLSGERFANLKQLENIPRVNWEQLIEDDLIFIA